MTKTMSDFKQMINQSMATASLGKNSGVLGQMKDVYGSSFFTSMRKRAGQALTKHGVDEYNHIKSWLLSGAKKTLKSVHPCTLTGNKGKRDFPLCEYLPNKRGATKSKLDTRAMLKVAQATAGTYGSAEAQFKKIQQNNLALFLRSVLLNVSDNPTTSPETQKYIAEALMTSQVELQALVN